MTHDTFFAKRMTKVLTAKDGCVNIATVRGSSMNGAIPVAVVMTGGVDKGSH